MWRQRLVDYEERSRDKLLAAANQAENTAEIKQQIATGSGASAERMSQAQIEAEQGRTIGQIGVDLGIPGIKETTMLAGKGINRLGLRLAGQIDTKQMLGLKSIDKPTQSEDVSPKAEAEPEDVFPTEEEAETLFREPEPEPEEPVEKALQPDEEFGGETLQEPKLLSRDIDQPGLTEGEIERGATEFGEKGTAQLAKNVGVDVGEELGSGLATEVGSGLATVGSTLSTLATPLGWGLGIYGAVETIKDMVKGGKAYDAAVSKAKSQIANVNAHIAGLQRQVSADQFETKVGAAKPSFGSLAATPSIDTSKQVRPALSF